MRYTLMQKTVPVLSMDIDESAGAVSAVNEVLAPERLPVGVSCENGEADYFSLADWWGRRCIPRKRQGLRDAFYATMNHVRPQRWLTKAYGLSLSDQYWFCPDGVGLRWEDINFFDHPFSGDLGDVLFGAEPTDEMDWCSPDITTDGRLRKRWQEIDGKRCLVKGGTGPFHQEPYNEALACMVMRRLGVAHVPYTIARIDDYPYSVCEDFITPKTDLVSAWQIMQMKRQDSHGSELRHYLNCCAALGIPGVRESIDRMLAVDFIIANEDRHFGNFGAVRDADTLEWLGLAPVFDSGTSLWCNQLSEKIHPQAWQRSRPFSDYHAEQIRLVSSFDWLDLSALRGIDEEAHEMLRGSAFIDEARRDVLCRGPAGARGTAGGDSL